MTKLEKIREWSERAYRIAAEHGWHDEEKSDELWMSLVMSEVAELVEADRKGRNTSPNIESEYDKERLKDDTGFFFFYDAEVKGTIQEEFADIIIRLLDYAYMKWGDCMEEVYDRDFQRREGWTIPEHAWRFCKDILDIGHMSVVNSIWYMIDWAEDAGVDLDMHVEWKMRYNSLRPYRHGHKKY